MNILFSSLGVLYRPRIMFQNTPCPNLLLTRNNNCVTATTNDHAIPAFTCDGSLKNFINAAWATGSDKDLPVLKGTIIKPMSTENKGTIYQYVGDEVVVAWNYDEGIENQHCIRCFFDMKLHIQKNREKYLSRYGLVPSFKAGIHCGKVIAGEVGIIKRDITYSGDVLNTTSRILSKCAELNAEMIASSDLLSEIRLVNNYTTKPLGAIKLKGKEREISLSELTPA